MTTSRRARARLVLPALLGLVALVFAGTFDNGFVNWDDGIYIAGNPLVTDPGAQPNLARLTTPNLGYAVPIPVWIYGRLWRWSPSPWVFHLASLTVHLLNVALAFVALRRFHASIAAAALGSLAFGVHPIVVEPVAWATGLKDLAMATGALVALLGFRRGWPALGGACVAFGSKPASVLLGAPLLALQWVAPRAPDNVPRSRALGWTIAGLVTVLGLGLAAYTAMQETATLRTSSLEPVTVHRVLGALGLQITHLVAPAMLAPRYPASHIGPLELAVGAAMAMTVFALATRWTRRKDPRLAWLMLGVAAYLPVSNLRPLERFIADSYMYLPWLGIAGVATLSWPGLVRVLEGERARLLRLARGSTVAVIVAWALLAAGQVEIWTDSVTLWRASYLEQPTDAETIYRYGDALGRAGRLPEEVALYLEHEDDLGDAVRIPIALPVYYARSGRHDRAQRWFRRAFESPVEQDAGMYWSYVEYVAQDPRRHDRRLDDALAYAIGQYVTQRGTERLDATARSNLAVMARRLGRADAATVLDDGAGP